MIYVNKYEIIKKLVLFFNHYDIINDIYNNYLD